MGGKLGGSCFLNLQSSWLCFLLNEYIEDLRCDVSAVLEVLEVLYVIDDNFND